jgi:hypothetical protein
MNLYGSTSANGAATSGHERPVKRVSSVRSGESFCLSQHSVRPSADYRLADAPHCFSEKKVICGTKTHARTWNNHAHDHPYLERGHCLTGRIAAVEVGCLLCYPPAG